MIKATEQELRLRPRLGRARTRKGICDAQCCIACCFPPSVPQKHHKGVFFPVLWVCSVSWAMRILPNSGGKDFNIKLQCWCFKSWPVALGVSSSLVQASILAGAKHLQRICYEGKVFKNSNEISQFTSPSVLSPHISPQHPRAPAAWANQTVLSEEALGRLIWSPFTFPQLLLSFGT